MERNSSIFPAYFAGMTEEERKAIRESIEQQRANADRRQLLRLDMALHALQAIWNECPAQKQAGTNDKTY